VSELIAAACAAGLPVRHTVGFIPVQADRSYGHGAGRRISSQVPTGTVT